MGSLAIYWDFENIHASLGNLRHGDKNWYRKHRDETQQEIVQLEVVMENAASIGDVNINRASIAARMARMAPTSGWRST